MQTYIRDNCLYHFGIKGMRWGVRRTPEELGRMSERKLQKMARKDAKRYAEAKMYYGEGAGNRRKLLKADLSNKMKVPEYKKAFEEYVNNADYAGAANKARGERNFHDRNKKIKRVVKAAAAVGAFAAGIYYAANKDAIDKVVTSCVNKTLSSAVNTYRKASDSIKTAKLRRDVDKKLNNKG